MYNYELDKAFSLIKDFYNTTGQSISLFDPEFNMVCDYPKKRCEFCSLIRANPEGKKRCIECDISGMKESQRKRKTVIYRCHAGLIEVCTPIIDDNNILGYLMLGQILYRDSFDEQCKNAEYLANDLMDDIVSLRNALHKVRQIDRDYLISASNIMRACVYNIIYEQLLKFEKGSLWDKLKEYITVNYMKNPSLEEISDNLSVSVATLCKTAKSHGCTVGKLILDAKVEKSKQILENSSLPINEISSIVGFNDYNYFTRAFKKHTGFTPSQWRKDKKSGNSFELPLVR